MRIIFGPVSAFLLCNIYSHISFLIGPKQIGDRSGNMLRADFFGGWGGRGGGGLLLLQDTWIIVALYFLFKH